MLKEKCPFGIYHPVNDGHTTWYDFAQELFKLSGDKIHLEPCTSEEFPRPAKRPKYSYLNNNKMPGLRPWQEAIGEYLA